MKSVLVCDVMAPDIESAVFFLFRLFVYHSKCTLENCLIALSLIAAACSMDKREQIVVIKYHN